MSGPGTQSALLWCRKCRREFEVVGSRRSRADVTPVTEWVTCPTCKLLRRHILPGEIEGPITSTSPLDRRKEPRTAGKGR